MKTLEPHYRNQLEAEVLSSILRDPTRLELVKLDKNEFMNPICSKVFETTLLLKQEQKPINLVTLSDFFPASEIASLLSEEKFNIYTTPDFINACKKLTEDTTRHLINQKVEECGDSMELYRWMKLRKSAESMEIITNFETDFSEYEKDYGKSTNPDYGSDIMTSWEKFNETVSPSIGDYIVVGARTSIGKTSFCLNLAIEAAMYGSKVLFVSVEMTKQRLIDKILANLTGKDSTLFKYGKIDLSKAKDELATLKQNFKMVFAPKCTSQDLFRFVSAAGNPKLVVVDYLQLLKDQPEKGGTENLRLGRVSGNLKALAGEKKCIVVAPAQLNRDSEKNDRKPLLSDLRDSGCIEQDADVVVLLHRQDREKMDTEVIIAKNRNGGLGKIDFLFNPPWCQFKENKEYIKT